MIRGRRVGTLLARSAANTVPARGDPHLRCATDSVPMNAGKRIGRAAGRSFRDGTTAALTLTSGMPTQRAVAATLAISLGTERIRDGS